MQHPTDDELTLFALGAAEDGAAVERHLARCDECRRGVETYRALDAGLSDGETWALAEHGEEAGDHQEALRGLAAQIAEEDETADELLRRSPRTPASLAWLDAADARMTSGGVVRAILAAAHEALSREPLDALALAELGGAIADRLPDDNYPGKLIHDLRGNAWKERANALRILGRYDETLRALDAAAREYAFVPASPLGPATVTFIRATVHFERNEYEEGLRLAAASQRQFLHIGDRDRYMRARHLEATIRFHLPDIVSARRIYEEILAWAESRNDHWWIGRESQALGHCLLELGDVDRARQLFERALHLFRMLRATIEVMRTEWGMGRVLLASGRAAEAVAWLSRVEKKFQDHQLLTDSALVALYAMDGLYVQEAFAGIAAKAAHLITMFTQAGMLTSALEAFAYLKEAAVRKRVTPILIEHVRRFVIRAEGEPDLLFAPPPPES